MNPHSIQEGFLEELQKIGASVGKMRVAQSREGRRPISVHNLLQKEKDGDLYKHTSKTNVLPDGSGFFTGTVGKKEAASRFSKAAGSIGDPTVAYISADTDAPAVAKTPRKRFQVPSREDVESHSVGDARENRATIPGSGTQLTDVGVTASPGGERNS